jgi:hypothetical protein
MAGTLNPMLHKKDGKNLINILPIFAASDQIKEKSDY